MPVGNNNNNINTTGNPQSPCTHVPNATAAATVDVWLSYRMRACVRAHVPHARRSECTVNLSGFAKGSNIHTGPVEDETSGWLAGW